MSATRGRHGRALRLLLVLGLVGLAALLLSDGRLALFQDPGSLRGAVERFGLFGPLAVIAALAAAIVFTPIPSAPIALAAGAAYGHVWGTVYVVIGAELGALLAFAIARVLGYEFVQRRFGERVARWRGDSQTLLMVVVFASRLLPFISFDIVSYGAGLTALRAWRFAVATLIGIVPASFALAHFGGAFVASEPHHVAVAALALGALTGGPIVYRMLRRGH